MPSPDLPLSDRLNLYDKAVVGGLNESERALLESVLQSSTEHRADFRHYVALHVELAAAVRLERARQAVYDVIRTLSQEESNVLPVLAATESTSSPSLVVPRTRSIGYSQAGWWSLASAVAVAIAFVVGSPWVNKGIAPHDLSAVYVAPTETTTTMPPAPVATVVSARDAVWAGPSLADGQAIRERDTITLLSGEANVSVGYGAELLIQGPSTLRFLALDRVQLLQGSVAVQVAEWAKGFTVVTSSMDVVDLGTTFTVISTPDGRNETQVISGQVRVHPKIGSDQVRRGLLVSERESLAVDQKGRHETIRVTPEALAQVIDFPTTHPYRPLELHSTGYRLAVGDEDPHWRIVAGPEGVFKRPIYAAVCKPTSEEDYLPNEPSSSQWVSVTNWRECTASAVYTFQTEFDLSGYDLSTVQLFGRFLADNGIKEVRVNGVPIEVQSWTDNQRGQGFRDRQFRFVNVTNGLAQRQNTVEIDVLNGTFMDDHGSLKGVPNPMALRVEWLAFGRQMHLVDARNMTEHAQRISNQAPFDSILATPSVAWWANGSYQLSRMNTFLHTLSISIDSYF